MLAAVGRQIPAQLRKIGHHVDLPERIVLWHVTFDAGGLEKLVLHRWKLPHPACNPS